MTAPSLGHGKHIQIPVRRGVASIDARFSAMLRAAERSVLAATVLGSSMAFIDGTVVNVALPALQAALHANVEGLQWIVESYAVSLAALLLVG